MSSNEILNQRIEIIDNHLGRVFPAPALIGGYLFLIFGFLGLISGYLIGLVIALIGAFVCFSFSGIQVDLNTRRIKLYTSYFGFKKGETKDLTLYPFICIFKSNKSYSVYSRTNRSTSYSEITYDIYLLTKTHKEKVLLKIEKGQESAIESAKKLAALLDLEVVQYNPVVKSRINKR